MNDTPSTFWFAIWGALSGTLALAIQYFTYQRDKARLRVSALFAYGSDLKHGQKDEHYLDVSLTNRGRGYVRIKSIAISLLPLWKYRLIQALAHVHWRFRQWHIEIGIYQASTDPIDDILAAPNVTTYPPKTLILEHHETKDIRLTVGDEVLSHIPSSRGILIVYDHIGKRHYAKFNPFNMSSIRHKDGQQET